MKVLNKILLMAVGMFTLLSFANASTPKFSVKPMGIKLQDVLNNKSKIDEGNLTIGQSGIVVHIYDNGQRLIVSNAKVVKSDETSSVVEFFPFDDLEQDAVPTTKRKARGGDILVLNYLYDSSLIIAPSKEVFDSVKSNFKYNRFLQPDIFAAQLKFDHKPYPSKEDIQKFAIKQNLGTIFIVVNQKVYILDTKTLKKLAVYDMTYKKEKVAMPFYSRVKDVKSSIFSSSLLKSASYEKYYLDILK